MNNSIKKTKNQDFFQNEFTVNKKESSLYNQNIYKNTINLKELKKNLS